MQHRSTRALVVGLALTLALSFSACDKKDGAASAPNPDRYVGDWQNVNDPADRMKISKAGENFTVDHEGLGKMTAVAKDGVLEVATSIGSVKAVYDPATDQITFTSQYKRATGEAPAPQPAARSASQDKPQNKPPEKPIVRTGEEPSGAPVMNALTVKDAIDVHGRFQGLMITKIDSAGSLIKSYGLAVNDTIIGTDNRKFEEDGMAGHAAALNWVLDAYQKQRDLWILRDGDRVMLKGRAVPGAGPSTAPAKKPG